MGDPYVNNLPKKQTNLPKNSPQTLTLNPILITKPYPLVPLTSFLGITRIAGKTQAPLLDIYEIELKFCDRKFVKRSVNAERIRIRTSVENGGEDFDRTFAGFFLKKRISLAKMNDYPTIQTQL